METKARKIVPMLHDCIIYGINPLSTKFTNCMSVFDQFVGLELKGLT